MRIIKIILLVISFSAFAQEKQLTEKEVSTFHSAVLDHATSLETMTGDFVQTKNMKMLSDESKSSGKLYYMAPDVLKWEYTKPYQYKILLMEEKIHINDEGQKSVTDIKSNKLFGQISELISGSVSGKLLNDHENFSIDYYRNGKLTLAKITPKDAMLARMFREIILHFDDANFIKSVRLVEESGDFTHIEISNLELNKAIDAGIFKP